MLKFTSFCRLSAVAGLLGVAVLSLGSSAAALPTPIYGKPTPPIVPEGQDGELDHTFGSNDDDGIDGFTRIGPSSSDFASLLHKSVQQSDGKFLNLRIQDLDNDTPSPTFESALANNDELVNIAAVGATQSTLERLNSDGSLDTSFSQNGSVLLDEVVGAQSAGSTLALQVDGKILVGVTSLAENFNLSSDNSDMYQSNSATENQLFLLRFLSDGTLDPQFGSNGVLRISQGLDHVGFVNSISVQTNGKITIGVVQYYSQNPNPENPNPEWTVTQFNADGSFDTSFASNGTFNFGFGTQPESVGGIFVQTDAKIVIVGYDFEWDVDEYRLHFFALRLHPNGAIDPSYGIDGKFSFATSNASSGADLQASMQPDNRLIYVEADVRQGYVYLGRLTADGTQDLTFGDPTYGPYGEQRIGDGLTEIHILDVAIQPDGKITATGYKVTEIDPTLSELVVYRFRNDGSIDYTFGSEGHVTFDLEPNLAGLQVIVQPDGKLVIFGIRSTYLDRFDFALRLNSAIPVSVNGVTPSRLFDTRVGSPQGSIVVDKTTYGGSKELRVKVAGVSGLPEYGIGAATINLTVTDPDDTGYITVYPCGTRPLASNMNYVFDQTVSTSVTTAVSPTGEICVYSSAQTNLIADINSWSAPNAGYAPLTPQRLVDTRALSPQGAITVVKKKYGTDSELRVKVAGAAGLPGARIGSVSLNVTVTEPETEGFITVYPCGTRPLASHLNFVADQTISASVTSPVSADGEICIYSSSPTNLIADTFGWFVQGSGITPVGPTRLVDTRSASPQGAISVTQKKYGATDELRLPLNDVAGLPDDGIGTVQLTVTATNPSDTGFITVYPCGTLPLASHLNYTTNQTIAASVTAQVSTDSEICVHSSQPTNIIIDINGWGNQIKEPPVVK
jgi:uncharacterized delta-60 repeat protein